MTIDNRATPDECAACRGIGVRLAWNTHIKYFSDTDTALVEFTDNPVATTQEISENIYFDLDRDGNPVSMTIEHASKTAHLPDISYQHIGTESV